VQQRTEETKFRTGASQTSHQPVDNRAALLESASCVGVADEDARAYLAAAADQAGDAGELTVGVTAVGLSRRTALRAAVPLARVNPGDFRASHSLIISSRVA